MFQNLHLSKPESDYQLEYYNAIGLLFSDHLILNKDNKLIEFNIDEIKSISFQKERELNQNYLILLLGGALLTFSYYFTVKEILFQKIGILLAVSILLYALLKRSYAYKIVLFTQYSHLFSIPVNDQDKEDACELITKTTLKVRTHKKYMQAS